MSSLAIYLTSCPSCGAQQKVNPNAFKLAAGKVHCVKCGCMFDASKHRQSSSTPSPTSASTKVKNTPVASPKSHSRNSQSPSLIKEITHSVIKGITGLLIVLSLLAAAFQLLFYNQQKWSDIDWLAPIYQQLSTFGKIQPKPTEQFRQLSLVINPDETYDNVTNVSFSFQNISLNDQLLPRVRLTFSDLKGKTVSERIFDVSEYSTDQAPLSTAVKPSQTISAKLQILQPAKRGLNYQLQLLSPQN